ncbi:tail fiber assembly protein [Serratia symbiotica]|uniref:Tail fiber assembly protein n=1 Tax=Serratia symbiotica TaxID=138074 RepID=A0A068Z7G0_9GAMM|nr:tail fiber assembly protein [Serratia symbiotica]QLH61667.1 tail fiber assembly protein [Serratia symbiotica]QLH63311.1 tail fiber assembly protein [Serratia symbiotica]CDS56885.1 Tail fiber assembly protein from lambdoid prophage [Serratia symbiotica]
MKTYARIEDQRVAEIVSLNVKPEKLYHPSLVWVDITALPEQPDINYRYSDGVFTAPVTDAENAALIASSRLAAEMDGANRVIAPLQDAVDTVMATEEETARLTEWKKYRVLLSRIDVSAAPDITWPDKPK